MSPKKRSRNWVSKTDLVRWVRCPYAAWLLYKGEISFEDTVDDIHIELINDGVAFQRAVEAKAIKIEVTPRQRRLLFEQDIALLRPGPFENRDLRIYGEPDGIETAAGALIPIEIKSHKNVQRFDELELAFYWMLLEPHRTRDLDHPRGVLILRRDGGDVRVEVEIPLHRFAEVRALLAEIRVARRRGGVLPRVCRCAVCSTLKREDVMAAARSRKDLTLIYGISRTYARALESLGIASYEALIACDPETVVAGLREQRYYVGVSQVNEWRRHAEAWRTQEPVAFAAEPLIESDGYIALDLEYLNVGFIYLIGACVVTTQGNEHHTWWADDDRGERRCLRTLGELVASYPELPVVTWAGECADIPQVFRAGVRTRLSRSVAPMIERHVDAFRYAERGLRLPIPHLGLKDLADYFGLPRVSQVRGGMRAEMMYMRYRSPTTDAEQKAAIKAQLTDYNSEDVETLIGVVEQVRRLTTDQRTPATKSLAEAGIT